MRKWIKYTLLIWTLFGLAFLAYIPISYQSNGVEQSILQSNSTIVVDNNDNCISFSPRKAYEKILIFFPGAMVDPMAYTPLCRNIADKGYKSIIIKMPWRIGSYDTAKLLALFSEHPKQYILAGHSKGGSLAAQFVYEHPKLIGKLILMGTTQPRDFSLSKSKIPIMKIYGSKDGVAETSRMMENKSKLPPSTVFVEIKGGNHSQFGYYGFQIGDHQANIGREEQQKLILENVIRFIKN